VQNGSAQSVWDPSGIYAGKTREEWQRELAERETAMYAVKKQIDAIAASLNNYSSNWPEQQRRLQEHKSLRTQLGEMRTEYFQKVETARKAGLAINIEQ
jgi:hypothetical protein